VAIPGETGVGTADVNALASEVRRRAGALCEYCRLPEAAFARPFHIEHIIAKQHGGLTQLDNLALACWACNLRKGPNLTGIDPETGHLTPLFNPRQDVWTDHFPVQCGNPDAARGRSSWVDPDWPNHCEATGHEQ
jgi:hypothetical protein